MDNLIQVAVAVIRGPEGYLLSQRQQGQHLAGKWEFPGGKLENGESAVDALCREIQEELGLTVLNYQPLIEVQYTYPEKTVLLSTWVIDRWHGKPQGREGQAIDWFSLDQIKQLELPEANQAIITALELPASFAICNVTETAELLRSAVNLDYGLRLRHTTQEHQVYKERVFASLRSLLESGANLPQMISLDTAASWEAQDFLSMVELMPDMQWGLHIKSYELAQMSELSQGEDLLALLNVPQSFSSFLGASCHSAVEVELANRISADYIFLSPVCQTSTHPGVQPLGWAFFAQCTRQARCPVYGLGGLGVKDIPEVRSMFGQGIAGISWWCNPS